MDEHVPCVRRRGGKAPLVILDDSNETLVVVLANGRIDPRCHVDNCEPEELVPLDLLPAAQQRAYFEWSARAEETERFEQEKHRFFTHDRRVVWEGLRRERNRLNAEYGLSNKFGLPNEWIDRIVNAHVINEDRLAEIGMPPGWAAKWGRPLVNWLRREFAEFQVQLRSEQAYLLKDESETSLIDSAAGSGDRIELQSADHPHESLVGAGAAGSAGRARAAAEDDIHELQRVADQLRSMSQGYDPETGEVYGSPLLVSRPFREPLETALSEVQSRLSISRRDDVAAESEPPDEPAVFDSVADAALHLFDVEIPSQISRFRKPGWFYRGPTTVACPDCHEPFEGFRKPYVTKAGKTYHYWALLCCSCATAAEPAELSDDSRKALYKQSRLRPTNSQTRGQPGAETRDSDL